MKDKCVCSDVCIQYEGGCQCGYENRKRFRDRVEFFKDMCELCKNTECAVNGGKDTDNEPEITSQKMTKDGMGIDAIYRCAGYVK